MRTSRFTEEQIVGIPQEHAAGAATGGADPAARDFARDVVQVAPEERRPEGRRGQATARARVPRLAYGGASKDTSAGPGGSFRPHRTQALTVRIDRRWTHLTTGLGIRVARAGIVLDAADLSVALGGEFMSAELLPEIGWRVFRPHHGALLELYGGPVIGVWTFEDFEPRVVPGGTIGAHGDFPIIERLALSVRISGTLMGSVFRERELPPELVLRLMRRSEIALGLRYGR